VAPVNASNRHVKPKRLGHGARTRIHATRTQRDGNAARQQLRDCFAILCVDLPADVEQRAIEIGYDERQIQLAGAASATTETFFF
jgi:hypothetical protein